MCWTAWHCLKFIKRNTIKNNYPFCKAKVSVLLKIIPFYNISYHRFQFQIIYMYRRISVSIFKTIIVLKMKKRILYYCYYSRSGVEQTQ